MIRKKSKRDRSGSYAVGYGRPPKARQYKPGQSGNKRGQPKGRKNYDTILDEILHRKLPMRDRGRVRHVTVIEAILLKFTELALRGNPKAAAFVFNRYSPAEPEEATEDLANDDRDLGGFRKAISHKPRRGRHEEQDRDLVDAILRNDFWSFVNAVLSDAGAGQDVHAELAPGSDRLSARARPIGDLKRLILNLPPALGQIADRLGRLHGVFARA